MFAGTEGADGSSTVAQHLLLDFLADRQQQRDTALSTSARSFLTCRLFADELTGLRSAGTPSSERQSQMLRRYQALAEQLGKGLKCGMSAGNLVDHNMALRVMLLIQLAYGKTVRPCSGTNTCSEDCTVFRWRLCVNLCCLLAARGFMTSANPPPHAVS